MASQGLQREFVFTTQGSGKLMLEQGRQGGSLECKTSRGGCNL